MSVWIWMGALAAAPDVDVVSLCEHADSVVQGAVVAQKVEWVGEKLHTHSLVQVTDVVLGEEVQLLDVVTVGGRLPSGLTLTVSHEARLEPGERYVLFLKEREEGLRVMSDRGALPAERVDLDAVREVCR